MLKLLITINGVDTPLTVENARSLYNDLRIVFRNDTLENLKPGQRSVSSSTGCGTRATTAPSTKSDIQERVSQAYPTNPGYDVSKLNPQVEAAKAEARSRTSGCGAR